MIGFCASEQTEQVLHERLGFVSAARSILSVTDHSEDI
jgi:hypothetical protein